MFRDKFPSYFLLDNADFDESLRTDVNLFTANRRRHCVQAFFRRGRRSDSIAGNSTRGTIVPAFSA